MRPRISITRFQWTQLYALAFVHLVIDTFPGAIAAILPAIRTHFSLSLTRSVSLITICYLSCNIFQILLGHVRSHKKKPLLLTIGTALVPAICFIAFIPVFRGAYWLLALAMFVTGFGVAIVHPESLRVLHNLKRIPSALGTAIFLNGGFLGFSAGAFLSASLVQAFGLRGLYLMIFPALLCIALIYIFHIRLAIEKPEKIHTVTEETYSFWLLFAMSAPIAVTATILPALLPTALAGMGFKLAYGGLPAAMLGIGAIAGSFFWADMAKRFGQLNCAFISEALAFPLVIVYLALIKNPWSVILLLPTGFCGGAGYTLLVSMARHSRNLVLGQRMGIIVGGVWGGASVVLILVGPLAERFGSISVLNFTPAGYAAAAIIGFAVVMRKRSHQRAARR
ncbi:MAG: MFS transporter [Planctomycetes bacterium]|nr:MFS transporter [Planctomycetota bacterium]